MSERIGKLTLDDKGIQRSQEAEHERLVAMTDLMHENSFSPVGMNAGPYTVTLSVQENRLVFGIDGEGGGKARVALSVQPLRSIIRDYFLICESYYEALKGTGAAKLEAIDMGRRGVHNEGSEILQEMLEGKISVDFKTARRLFTLICVLHIK